MPKTQRILTTTLWGLMVLAMVSVISAGLFRSPDDATGQSTSATTRPASPPVIGIAPQFSMLDQEGGPLTTDSLKGKVWVADFIFTHCAGPCRDMTRKMAEFQKELNNPSVQFVSISVDPKRDTPATLKQFGDEFQADVATWKFITGDPDKIQDIAHGMLQAMEPEKADQPILHSERFILVDAAGNIRASAHTKDADAMKQFMADVKAVAEQAQ